MGITTSSWCVRVCTQCTQGGTSKETILRGFMCSAYNNYTVNLLCSRRVKNNSNKLADGTVLTSKGWRRTTIRNQRERSEQQYRVESKVGNECLASRKDCLGNKQTVRADKMICICGCYRCLCPHLMSALCECAKKDNALMFPELSVWCKRLQRELQLHRQ